jgi:hypothetical protein
VTFSRVGYDSVAHLGLFPRHVCSHELFNIPRKLSETHRMAANFQGMQQIILKSFGNHFLKQRLFSFGFF